jgi:hypothetical protein
MGQYREHCESPTAARQIPPELSGKAGHNLLCLGAFNRSTAGYNKVTLPLAMS